MLECGRIYLAPPYGEPDEEFLDVSPARVALAALWALQPGGAPTALPLGPPAATIKHPGRDLWCWLGELQSGKEHRVVFAKVGSWSDKWETLTAEQLDLLQHRSFDYDKSQSDEGERAVWLAVECRHRRGVRAADPDVQVEVKRYLDSCNHTGSHATQQCALVAVRKIHPNATREQVTVAMRGLTSPKRGRPRSG
jgi:hypothetical protein